MNDLPQIARRVMWWVKEQDAGRDPVRLACQVMTLGTWDDVLTMRAAGGDELFQRALRTAPAGVFDKRSWNFWHLVFGITPVPPLPARQLS